MPAYFPYLDFPSMHSFIRRPQRSPEFHRVLRSLSAKCVRVAITILSYHAKVAKFLVVVGARTESAMSTMADFDARPFGSIPAGPARYHDFAALPFAHLTSPDARPVWLVPCCWYC